MTDIIITDMERRLIKLETLLDSHVANCKENSARTVRDNQILWEKLADHQKTTANEVQAILIKLEQHEKSNNEKFDKFDIRLNKKLDDLNEKMSQYPAQYTRMYMVIIGVLVALLSYFMVEGVPWLHPDKYIKKSSFDDKTIIYKASLKD